MRRRRRAAGGAAGLLTAALTAAAAAALLGPAPAAGKGAPVYEYERGRGFEPGRVFEPSLQPETAPAPGDPSLLRLDGPLPDIPISIHYDGATLRLSGRVAGGPPDGPGAGLALVVTGESRPTMVMRKESRFGLWMNVDRRLIPAAPVFYAAARYGEAWPQALSPEALIAAPRWVRGSVAGPAERFREAVTRLRAAEQRYALDPAPIRFDPSGAFKTSLRLPPTLLAGRYRVRVALMEGGAARAWAERRFEARKVGVAAWLRDAASHLPLLYGAATLLIAIGAGWVADRVFRAAVDRRLRGGSARGGGDRS